MLDKALDAIGYRTFVVDEQPRLRAIGKRVGIGVVFYVEGTGIGPYEGATIQVQGSGRVLLATGIGTQGQGHFTSFAQIVADQIGVAVTDIDVVRTAVFLLYQKRKGLPHLSAGPTSERGIGEVPGGSPRPQPTALSGRRASSRNCFD